MARIHQSDLLHFAAGGAVYRCFGHAFAARFGALLAVPLHLLDGDLRRLVDGCPVNYEEALTVATTPLAMNLPIDLALPLHAEIVREAARFDTGWRVQPALMACGGDAIWILVSCTGLRLGVSPDLVYQTPLEIEETHAAA